MYNTFDFQDVLFDLFLQDAELCELLEIHDSDDLNLVNEKLRREDVMPSLFSAETLDFVAFYFADVDASNNYLVNKGMIRLDIYSKYRDSAGKIRQRCVELIRGRFDIRVISEYQVASDITDVYKYRLVFLPLISS